MSQDRIGCCQMATYGAFWLTKHYPSTLISVFLTGFRYLHQIATQLSARSRMDPVPDPILPEKFLGYSRESNLLDKSVLNYNFNSQVPSTLISLFLTGFRYLHQIATQLSSRGRLDPAPVPILTGKFIGFMRESNMGPLG